MDYREEDAQNVIDWSAFGDGPAAVERRHVENGGSWATCRAAGIQFYDYGRSDELGGRVVPLVGDRLAVVRRPDNRADSAACELWWRNHHMLGHLPRTVAWCMAERMDLGESLRAYVLDPGDGSAWSMRVLLVGPACVALHGRRLEAWTSRETLEGARATWGERRTRSQLERIPPSKRKMGALAAWEARLEATRARRRTDALYAFARMAAEEAPSAEQEPDETMRDMRFARWPDVPLWLRTRKQLKELGFKPSAGARPFALKAGGYGPYNLFLVRDAVPLRARVQDVACDYPWERRRDGT